MRKVVTAVPSSITSVSVFCVGLLGRGQRSKRQTGLSSLQALHYALDQIAYVICITLLIPASLCIGAGLVWALVEMFIEALCK